MSDMGSEKPSRDNRKQPSRVDDVQRSTDAEANIELEHEWTKPVGEEVLVTERDCLRCGLIERKMTMGCDRGFTNASVMRLYWIGGVAMKYPGGCDAVMMRRILG